MIGSNREKTQQESSKRFRLSPPPYRSRPRARARYRFLTALAAIGCLIKNREQGAGG